MNCPTTSGSRELPLDCLLEAAGKMPLWSKKCSGPQLAQAVIALCGVDVKELWNTSADSYLRDGRVGVKKGKWRTRRKSFIL